MKKNLNKLKSLAKQNDAEAQYLLGTEYIHAEYLPYNPNCALFWYLESAKLGYTAAKFEAGMMLLNGEDGVPANKRLAQQLLISAAEATLTNACLFLKHCYAEGKYGFNVDLQRSDHFSNLTPNTKTLIFSEGMDIADNHLDISCSDK